MREPIRFLQRGRRTPDVSHRRLIRLAPGALALLLASTSPLFASEFPEADHYFALRDRGVVTASPDRIAQQPAAFRGKLIEIRGVVGGQARRDGGSTVILNTPTGLTYLVETGPIQEGSLDLGHTVRILARVGIEPAAPTPSASGKEGEEFAGTQPPSGAPETHLVMVGVVSEYDAAQLETLRARRAAAEARAASARTRTRSQTRSRYARRQLASRSYSVLGRYRDAVHYFNSRLSPEQAERIARSILWFSNEHGLDARLVMAVIAVESNFNAGAVSSKGAMGLGQLMPGTAMGLGVRNPWSPEENIAGATRLLRGHLERMRGLPAGEVTEEQLKLALACYNAGLGAVKKYGGVPPYRETRNYVKKVTRLYRQMCGIEP